MIIKIIVKSDHNTKKNYKKWVKIIALGYVFITLSLFVKRKGEKRKVYIQKNQNNPKTKFGKIKKKKKEARIGSLYWLNHHYG